MSKMFKRRNHITNKLYENERSVAGRSTDTIQTSNHAE